MWGERHPRNRFMSQQAPHQRQATLIIQTQLSRKNVSAILDFQRRPKTEDCMLTCSFCPLPPCPRVGNTQVIVSIDLQKELLDFFLKKKNKTKKKKKHQMNRILG